MAIYLQIYTYILKMNIKKHGFKSKNNFYIVVTGSPICMVAIYYLETPLPGINIKYWTSILLNEKQSRIIFKSQHSTFKF